MQTANDLRNQADPDTLALLVASFPLADQIGPRDHFDSQWALRKIPSSDDDRRMEAINASLDTHREDLAHDIQRYTDLQTRKLHAMSDYDLTIAHGGDALGALELALGLKTAHISWQRSHIQVLEAELVAMELDRPQLALF